MPVLNNLRSETLSTVAIWLSSLVVVIAATEFAISVVPMGSHFSLPESHDVWSSLATWGGWNQRDIIHRGYQPSPGEDSLNAVFPPLYPLMSKAIIALGVRDETALVGLANGCFLGFLLLLSRYGICRHWTRRERVTSAVVMAFFPYSFFFRTAYAESTFCLFVIAYFLGRRSGYHPLVLAILVCGAATTRIVGVILIPLLIFDLKSRYLGWHGTAKAMAGAVVGSAGMFIFMLHLAEVAGDPLAFLHSQADWTIRQEQTSWERLWHAVSLQPLIDAYRPDCVCYWAYEQPHDLPLLNMQFMNPIIIVGTWILTAIGWRRRWLDRGELYYCVAVLAIPYLTQGYRICLHSQCRYAIVAFPLAFVIAKILVRLPLWVQATLVGILSAFLFANVVLFVSQIYTY